MLYVIYEPELIENMWDTSQTIGGPHVSYKGLGHMDFVIFRWSQWPMVTERRGVSMAVLVSSK